MGLESCVQLQLFDPLIGHLPLRLHPFIEQILIGAVDSGMANPEVVIAHVRNHVWGRLMHAAEEMSPDEREALAHVWSFVIEQAGDAFAYSSWVCAARASAPRPRRQRQSA